MKTFLKFFKDRFIKFELLGFEFDSGTYPEYAFGLCGIRLRDWAGSLLYLRYEPSSIEEQGDGFEFDILWLFQGVKYLIEWIQLKLR